ncbi:MAG: 1,4-alpha-glucan branching protein GlgB [Dehalococcoidia bacterium]
MTSGRPILGPVDLHLLAEGTHLRAFERLGAHVETVEGITGTAFAVWAPNARGVSVIGDFNGWDPRRHPMRFRQEAGVWELFVPGVRSGATYKFSVLQADGHTRIEKADPYAFAAELRPASASVVWDLEGYEWQDEAWMRDRARRNALDAPIAVYEVHLGSWMRGEQPDQWLSYQELATRLVDYVKRMGFTHVEFLPVSEHPLDASWGYQTLSYFAPTSRFGTPQDFMHLVDALHGAGIGVIVDWVPAHFPKDQHGLGVFDGTHLYEHEDPRLGEHPDWGTYIFNYARREVANFLLGNALFWLERYHLDGLRVDAVASMLYRDYSRKAGEWLPNQYGGRENIEAIDFLRWLNETVYREHPDVLMIAEESTAWPMVSRPTFLGGLGFGLKWNMGWMHDTLEFIARDPVHRSHHLGELTFSLLYAFHENFVLPFSHDEVVHGKGSMLGKMPGDQWQRMANLRALYAYMWGHPGKKLLFMGSEFGQSAEWNFDQSLDWHLLQYDEHRGVQALVERLNALYRTEPALYEVDFEGGGFEWLEASDTANVVISFVRYARERDDMLLFVCNLTPVPRSGYRLGVPRGGRWDVVLNTDDPRYGGSGFSTPEAFEADGTPSHARDQSVVLTLPPLAVLVLKPGAA